MNILSRARHMIGSGGSHARVLAHLVVPRPDRWRARARKLRGSPGAGPAMRAFTPCTQVGGPFFTRRPPSPRIVKALEHRHCRTGSTTRTDVTAPAGVGDHERVELQVSTFCSR